MRRAAALLVIPMLAAAAAAGCSSSSSSSAPSSSSSSKPASAPASSASSPAASSSPTGPTAASNSVVTASGKFGAAPTVTIPAENAATALYTKTIIQGGGAPLTTTDSLLGNFVLYDWTGTTHKLLGSTFSSGNPTLFAGQMLPGLEKALIGQKEGSRILAVIPPADGFGPTGNSQIGVGGKDTLVFVIDMIQDIVNAHGVAGAQTSDGGSGLPTVTTVTGKAPAIKIPVGTPPKTLQVKTLIKGNGHTIAKGDYIVVQYTGMSWTTKKIFDSSWTRSQPFPLNIGVGQVIKGWDTGLIGQKAGSRVLLVIPPAQAYGKSGQKTGGIPPNDTLVFVIDILAAAK